MLAVYGAAALLGYAACFAFSGGEGERLGRQIDRASATVARQREQIRRLADAIAGVRRELQAVRSVAGHPDWGLLLAVLADTLGEEVVLERCVLEPVGPPAAGGDEKTDPNSLEAMTARLRQSYRLDVAGIAQSQSGVSKFVLRLEEVGLFQRVKLIQTTRRTFADRRAVAFQVECFLDGRSGKEDKP